MQVGKHVSLSWMRTMLASKLTWRLTVFGIIKEFDSCFKQVDKHIRKLDADLARFEADLKEKNSGNREAAEPSGKKSMLLLTSYPLLPLCLS